MERKELAFALTWQRNTEPIGTAVSDLLRFLGTKLGRTIVPRVAIAYDELEPMFERGDVDFGWLPPLSFLRLRQKKLVRTLLVNQRHGAQAFHAVLAVRSGSRHYSLERLQGARAAWVDPYSTSGYVLARIDLAARGIDPRTTFGEERFLGSHDAAARAVLEGRSDIVGTFAIYEGDRVVRAGFSSQGSPSDWRIILRGREVPSDVLAAHTKIDDALATSLAAALRGAFEDDATAKLVRDVLHVDAFGDADDSRYTTLDNAVESARRDGLLPYL
jgi:phosphonate transport system substrate-binding protein